MALDCSCSYLQVHVTVCNHIASELGTPHPARLQAPLLAASNVAAVQHAVGDLTSAAESTETVLDILQQPPPGDEAAPDELSRKGRKRYIPAALQQIAALRAAQARPQNPSNVPVLRAHD